MRNIYLIVGPSGSGKTTLTEDLCTRYGYKAVSSYTDRPPRYPGEIGHEFLSNDEFNKLSNLCAYTEFNGYRYGVTSEMIDRCDVYVIDPAGVEYMREHYTGKKGISIIGLVVEPEVRYTRMKKRGDSKEQIESRLRHDERAFRDLNKIADIMVRNSDLKATVDFLHEFVEYTERQTIREQGRGEATEKPPLDTQISMAVQNTGSVAPQQKEELSI